MRLKLADQSAVGILDSLSRAWYSKTSWQGLSILLHALRYLNGVAIVSC